MRNLLLAGKWLIVLSLACLFLDVPPAPGGGCKQSRAEAPQPASSTAKPQETIQPH